MRPHYGAKGLLSLSGVFMAMLVYGCALQAVTTPPEGAVTAELGFPPVGTTWVIKTVVHGTGKTVHRTHAVLGETIHDGRPVYRTEVEFPIIENLFDKATRNWTARLRWDQLIRSASPYRPVYAFPLWVGKSWQGTFTYTDHERGDTYTNAVWRGKVTAYEDVTVPAGTFKAFKVEGGSAVSGVICICPNKVHFSEVAFSV